MQLQELSADYGLSARAIASRISELRALEQSEEDDLERTRLHRRILDLRPMQEQCRELELLTANYYNRRYCRSGKYRI